MTIETIKKKLAEIAPMHQTIVDDMVDYLELSILLPNDGRMVGYFPLDAEIDFNSIATQFEIALAKNKADGLFIIEGTTIIPVSAFKRMKMKEVVIPYGITEIGTRAFEGCSSLQNIIIPDSVTAIGIDAFRGCTSLECITIPDSVTKIGDGAFKGCTALQSINIPENLTEVGFGAFTDTGLTNLRKANKHIAISDSILTKDGVLVTVVGSPVDLVIPDSVTKIGDWAFLLCTSLKSVVIPVSVTDIGEGAFHSCQSLENVTIPDSVTKIGENAFYGCGWPTKADSMHAGIWKNPMLNPKL